MKKLWQKLRNLPLKRAMSLPLRKKMRSLNEQLLQVENAIRELATQQRVISKQYLREIKAKERLLNKLSYFKEKMDEIK